MCEDDLEDFWEAAEDWLEHYEEGETYEADRNYRDM